MFKAAVGHGIDPESTGAITEALEQCQQILGDHQPNAGILLCGIDFEYEEILHCIRQTYPDIVLIGGTSIGEMSSVMAFQEDSLTLMLFCSDEVTFHAGIGEQADDNAIAAAKAAVDRAIASPNNTTEVSVVAPALCYALGDGLGVDGAAMVAGLKASLGTDVPIIGGLTADDWQLKNTFQFISTPDRTQVVEKAIVALIFSGNLKLSYSIATGQRPIGPKGKVTKSHSGILYDIDEKPAKSFYQSNCGEQRISLTEGGSWGSAIAVFEPGKEDFYMRTPNGDGKAEGSIRYFGHVPLSANVQLTESDAESLLTATEEAVQNAIEAYPGTEPKAALMVSCAARMKLLGTRTKEEHATAGAFLDKHSSHQTLPNMGFYSYGEVSPFTHETEAHFHNETFTVLLIGT